MEKDYPWEVLAGPLLALGKHLDLAKKACEAGFAASLEHDEEEMATMWFRARQLLQGLAGAWNSGVCGPPLQEKP